MFDEDDICLNFGDEADDENDFYNVAQASEPTVSSNNKTNAKEKVNAINKTNTASSGLSSGPKVSHEQSFVKNNERLKQTKITKKSDDFNTKSNSTLLKEGQTKSEESVSYSNTNVKSSQNNRSQWSEKDDPSLYHASPSFLSQGALSAEPVVTEATQQKLCDMIFSRKTFQSLKLDSKLTDILKAPVIENGLNLTTSTRIQSVAIPLLNNHNSMLIKSQTGSGKTLCYLLPILNDLLNISPQIQRADGTYALIIAPTRELCGQITDILAKLTQGCVYIVGGLITGGEKRKSEKARLRKGVTVLVSTPGRLLDHLKTTESFSLTKLRWIVLDEADRLLDMGTSLSIFMFV